MGACPKGYGVQGPTRKWDSTQTILPKLKGCHSLGASMYAYKEPWCCPRVEVM